jgi:hypothetical protein
MIEQSPKHAVLSIRPATEVERPLPVFFASNVASNDQQGSICFHILHRC